MRNSGIAILEPMIEWDDDEELQELHHATLLTPFRLITMSLIISNYFVSHIGFIGDTHLSPLSLDNTYLCFSDTMI